MIKFLMALLLLFLAACGQAEGKRERDYQEEWCAAHGGKTEVTLTDIYGKKTRADCVTRTHAIELDPAKKWAEAIGQALHYARVSGLRAGIVLICLEPNDVYKFYRLKDNIRAYLLDITVWEIGCE
jgi:hypothetical protein